MAKKPTASPQASSSEIPTTNAGAEVALDPAPAPFQPESAPGADVSAPPAGDGTGELREIKESATRLGASAALGEVQLIVEQAGKLLVRLRDAVGEVEQLREQLRARVAEMASAPLAIEERVAIGAVDVARAASRAIAELAQYCGHPARTLHALKDLDQLAQG
jgi:hypothetical protein